MTNPSPIKRGHSPKEHRRSNRKTPVSLEPFEWKAISQAARSAGYSVADFLAVSAYKAATAPPAESPEPRTLLISARSLASKTAALQDALCGMATEVPAVRDLLLVAQEAADQALDVCRLAHLAESRTPATPELAVA